MYILLTDLGDFGRGNEVETVLVPVNIYWGFGRDVDFGRTVGKISWLQPRSRFIPMMMMLLMVS